MRRRLDRNTLLLVAWSVATSVLAQLLLRHGMASLGALSGVDLYLHAATSLAVLGGLLSYILSTVTWLGVLSRIDLSVAYPLASLNFVFVTALSAMVLRENVPPLRWAGTGLILVGILVVARGERDTATTSREKT